MPMGQWKSPILTGSWQDELSALLQARNLGQQETTLGRLFSDLGVDFFRLDWSLEGSSGASGQVVTLTNCPKSWIDRYYELGLQEFDPKLDLCRRSITPTVWDLYHLPADMDAKERFYWEALLEVQLDFMVTIPMRSAHSFSMLCVSLPRNQGQQTLEHICSHAYSLAPYLHDAVDHLMGSSAEPPSLTQRELECVMWAAEGKTAWETSQILSISERTTHFHLRNAMQKLGAANKMHTVSIAQRLSLLPERRAHSQNDAADRAPAGENLLLPAAAGLRLTGTDGDLR